MYLQPHLPYLHFVGPAQSPRVDKSNPAMDLHLFLEPGRGALKTISHAVQNGLIVTDRNYWQFAQDTFNSNDIENWFLVV
jgi:hypothetical protein